jgi:gamma-aminobutyric acid type B receptor
MPIIYVKTLVSSLFLGFIIITANVNCLHPEVEKGYSCERATGCESTESDGTVYFGLMLSYPDPLERQELAAAFDDGHDIAPAAYLAVEQINNRSDILNEYQIEVIRLDGGCTVTERTVVGVNELACSCKPVVGIIGPSCGTSALATGKLTNRDEFSVVTLHYGEKSIFGDSTVFPFAFGMLGSNIITIQAFTNLILQNHWTRTVLLYSEGDEDLREVSSGIEKIIKSTTGYDVSYTSPIYKDFIPLKEIRDSYARVIIVLASAESTLYTLCRAYHDGMIFPKYQWVFKERFDYEFYEISFHYDGDGMQYDCTDANINESVFGSINFVWSAVSAENNRTNTDVGLTSTEYEHQYNQQRIKYMHKYNVTSSTTTEWARGFYDAVWSLALALNSSLTEVDMNLTHTVTGSKSLAETVVRHMLGVDFQGISGRVKFDNETGSNIAGELNVYQFVQEKRSTLISFYTSGAFTMLNGTAPQFIESTFSEKRVQVSTALAVPFLIMTIATLIVALPIQIINIVYREHKTIKATSPNLNHIIFIGCYMTVLGTTLLIVTEAWQHTASLNKSRLCNVIPWILSIGTSMIIGTVTTKTWRLHRIYASSKRVIRLSPKLLSDPVLGGTVGVFVAIDILICLTWVSIDPLTSVRETSIEESGGEELPTVIVTVTCQSKWLIYWSSALIGYKCVLTGCSFILALLTRIKKKEFKTVNIIVMAYLFAITFGLGVPMYTIISFINFGVMVQFIILCLLMDTIVYICLFALFLPSIIPLIREKIFHYKDPKLTLRRHGTYIYSNKERQVMYLKPQNSVASIKLPRN